MHQPVGGELSRQNLLEGGWPDAIQRSERRDAEGWRTIQHERTADPLGVGRQLRDRVGTAPDEHCRIRRDRLGTHEVSKIGQTWHRPTIVTAHGQPSV